MWVGGLRGGGVKIQREGGMEGVEERVIHRLVHKWSDIPRITVKLSFRNHIIHIFEIILIFCVPLGRLLATIFHWAGDHKFAMYRTWWCNYMILAICSRSNCFYHLFNLWLLIIALFPHKDAASEVAQDTHYPRERSNDIGYGQHEFVIFTTHIRSVWEGYVFSSVCLSVIQSVQLWRGVPCDLIPWCTGAAVYK